MVLAIQTPVISPLEGAVFCAPANKAEASSKATLKVTVQRDSIDVFMTNSNAEIPRRKYSCNDHNCKASVTILYKIDLRSLAQMNEQLQRLAASITWNRLSIRRMSPRQSLAFLRSAVPSKPRIKINFGHW